MSGKSAQWGAGLVQIMVALTIGAIVSAGLIEILVASKRGYRVQEAQARVQAGTVGRHPWPAPLTSTVGRHRWPAPLAGTVGRANSAAQHK